ncbi:MAG: DEAD/DEAH box helicase [Cyanobacteria bacterium]|nr:DEAD/DEAH box helicase [Cyanobacteriota bacterium]
MAKFTDFNISKETIQAIEALGYDDATKIQGETLPLLLEGKDLIGQAQTGTGKTAAFAIPCIEKINTGISATQALIMCPTRELVIQVAGELKKLTKFRKDISIVPIYGGQNISVQLRALKNNCDIVIGTPGRLMDHMRRKSLKLDQVKYLVLDEADQMLDMGFRDDMKDIISQTSQQRQTVMFSATMSQDLVRLMERYQNKAIKINITGNKEQSQQIEQLYFNLKSAPKLDALKRLLTEYNVKSGIIFCNTKMKVDELTKRLVHEDYIAAALHGDIDQKKRTRVMGAFKAGSIELLVATDVAARGLDINDLEVVINYDLPRADQDYIHRIGRTGRAGKKGLALNLVTGKELAQISRIAYTSKLTINPAQLPGVQGTETLNSDSKPSNGGGGGARGRFNRKSGSETSSSGGGFNRGPRSGGGAPGGGSRFKGKSNASSSGGGSFKGKSAAGSNKPRRSNFNKAAKSAG